MDRKGTTIVSHTFGGTLQSDVVCLICGSESQKLDPILGNCNVFMVCVNSYIIRLFPGYTRTICLSEKIG